MRKSARRSSCWRGRSRRQRAAPPSRSRYKTPYYTMSHPDFWKVKSVAQKPAEPTVVAIGQYGSIDRQRGLGSDRGRDVRVLAGRGRGAHFAWPEPAGPPDGADPTERVSQLLFKESALELQKHSLIPQQQSECGQEFQRKYKVLGARAGALRPPGPSGMAHDPAGRKGARAARRRHLTRALRAGWGPLLPQPQQHAHPARDFLTGSPLAPPPPPRSARPRTAAHAAPGTRRPSAPRRSELTAPSRWSARGSAAEGATTTRLRPRSLAW